MGAECKQHFDVWRFEFMGGINVGLQTRRHGASKELMVSSLNADAEMDVYVGVDADAGMAAE